MAEAESRLLIDSLFQATLRQRRVMLGADNVLELEVCKVVLVGAHVLAIARDPVLGIGSERGILRIASFTNL